MKMKILLVLFLFIVIIVYSYKQLNKNEINYTIMGDKEIFSNNIISKNFSDLIYDEIQNRNDFGFYSEEFIENDIRIIDLINYIEDNKSIDNIYIQNILKKTSILLLHIGNNEVNYKLSRISEEECNDKELYSYLDEVSNDFEKLITIIRKYNENNILFLGIYDTQNKKITSKYYDYINKKMNIICKNNKIDFINTYDILNKNDEYVEKYITNKGNLALFNEIYGKFNKLYLHKNN